MTISAGEGAFTGGGALVRLGEPAAAPGHAQVFRMRPDGSGITQLTSDERVNWFPHLSPDGATVLLLSFPPGTEGHPGGRQVQLRAMGPAS